MALEPVGDAGTRQLGESALEKIDELLRERPQRIGHDFSDAVRCLAAYRDSLARAWRETGGAPGRDRLARVNAVLSVLVGGHFPLGPVPWDLIEKARRQLADVLAAGPAVPSP